jgi:two-component system, OmpR family, sensor kinase
MDQPAQRTGIWRSLRELPGRMPLRTTLISAVLALVAVALVVISTAGLIILRTNLLSTPDANLQQSIGGAAGAVQSYLNAKALGRDVTRTYTGLALDWVSGGHVQQVIIPVTGPNQGNAGGFAPQGPQTMSGPSIPLSSTWLAANSGHILTLPAQSGDGRWRVLMAPQQYQYPNGSTVTGTIVVAIDVTSVYRTIGQLAYIDLLASLAVICVLGIVVVAVIRRSLRPLLDIERTAGAIANGDLSRRVPERDPRTEVGRLGRSLNVMLSHIEAAFRARSTSEEAARRSEDKMRQFVADASHELRTPLTAIRGFAEYYRQRGGVAVGEAGNGHLASTDMDRIMRRVEQESTRMGVLVEDMLLLARLDQQRPLQAKPVDLLTLAADAVHDARVVAPDRSIHLTVGSSAALIVNGDEVRLRQVIGNLMTNALTHTPAGTPIDVLIRSGTLDEAPPRTPPDPDPDAPEPAAIHQPAAVLEVADHGPGLTEDQAAHVFERFYRGDPARTIGGTGLGLAIVAALVTGHGGAAWVRSEPGKGATFCIALPLTPEAAHPDDDDDENVASRAGDDARADSGDANPAASAGQDDRTVTKYWAPLTSPGS